MIRHLVVLPVASTIVAAAATTHTHPLAHKNNTTANLVHS